MKTLWEIFKAHKGRQIDKWAHYFPIYERHFERFRGLPIRVLEIGVDHGGSLEMWREYFGPKAHIEGVDKNPQCAAYGSVYISDETNPALASLGVFDIVIDDGSHHMGNQSVTFSNLWPVTMGVYLIEDCHGGYPVLNFQRWEGVAYAYPWVVVVERAKRIIRGTPSHPLRDDEVLAREQFAE